MSRAGSLKCKPLKGTIDDQPPMVRAMIRDGVSRALVVAPAGITLQREERDMGARQEWTAEDIEELRSLAQQGLTQVEIGERMGRSEAAIHGKLQKLRSGFQMSSKRGREKAPAVGTPPAASESVPELPPAVRTLAVSLLAHATQYARLSHLADTCLAAGLDIPDQVKDAIDAEVPQVKTDEVRGAAGRLIGWEVELPAGCGLCSVRVLVE